MKKFLAITALFVFAVITVFQLSKRQLAELVFMKALEERVASRLNAQWEDGIHVFICGAGAPMPALEAGPCTAVIAGERAFIFDAGSGSPRKLGLTSFPMERVNGIFFTHLHSDHFDSLGEMLLLAWIVGSRDTPLPVYGPAGTADVVNAFNAAYFIDRGFRVAHHGEDVANPAGHGGVPTELAPGVVYNDGGVKITAMAVHHEPVEPAFGYRIDYKDRSVTISGDTVFSEGFANFSKGTDLMVHEGLQPKMIMAMRDVMKENGMTSQATIMEDILDYHTSPEDAARVAQIAGADELIINHIVPPLPVKLLRPLFLGDARKNFDGKVHLAEDGMLFSLPVGSDAIHKSREF